MYIWYLPEIVNIIMKYQIHLYSFRMRSANENKGLN